MEKAEKEVMAQVVVNPDRVHEFPDETSFSTWLSNHHDTETEVWIKIHKLASGLKSITPKEAIDVALCWGWIDAIKKSYDSQSYLQRYTKRGKKSVWSKINVDNVARLIAEKRMTSHGLSHVEAAKADGRWDRAYGSASTLQIPANLKSAIDADPRAKTMFAKLNAQNRFALAFRMHNLKTEDARQRNIVKFVEMLRNGQTIYPQGKAKSS